MTQPKQQSKKPPVNGRRKEAKAAEAAKAKEDERTVPTHLVASSVRRARRR